MTEKKKESPKKEYFYHTHTISLSYENESILEELKEIFQCTRSSLINDCISTTLHTMKNDQFLIQNPDTNM